MSDKSFDSPRGYSLESVRNAVITGPHPPSPPAGMFDPTAVMALFSADPEIKLLFVQKADVKGYTWANQMAFPGGHQDKSDPSSRHTAFRELEEEMAIAPENVDLIGSIGHFQTLNNKDIEAWAGIWNRKDTIVYDSKEISRVVEIPLNRLIEIHQAKGYRENEPSIMTLTYPYEDIVIWGVTAKMVCHMINLIIS